MTKETLHVYIGFDTRNYGQTLAYEGCKRSIEANLNRDKYDVVIHQLNLKELMKEGHMYREVDPLAATEFTYTRFLVPFLNNYQGKALFCDSDFIWTCCVSEAFNYLEEGQAVACVQHEYTPHAVVKMNGLHQTNYPRKNWSSLMVFDCGHSSTQQLTVKAVNEQTPAWLHRMTWAKDEEIGWIPYQYNYLVGYYDTDDAKVYHYTDGGPWHPGYENVQYGEQWRQYMADAEIEKLKEELDEFYAKHPDYSKDKLLV